MKPSHLRPLTDSPWFWAHVFAAAALAAVLLRGSHVHQRQVQIERNGQGRQRALLQNPADQAKVTLSTDRHTLITLQPLTIFLLFVFIGSGVMLWRRRLARTLPEQRRSVSHCKGEGEP